MTVDPFTVWAPEPSTVSVQIRETRAGGAATTVELSRGEDGWWRPDAAVPDPSQDGEFDYGFSLDGGDLRPDPRSRWQPEGVHGLSRTYDPTSYAWGDEAWTGRQLAGATIYELHVGTFTPGGTLDSAIEKLDHLVGLGIDFVELMPVNAFNGEHNWGYDGVLWFAVHHAYGGPAAYQRFVDACHQRGLGVIQDAVYNHLGPSGNYLQEFGPYLTTGSTNTWGDTLNLDGEESDEIRRYIIDNAMMWMNDYHVDGLRLDAVHALVDNRAIHILEELATETEALSAFTKRPLSLIAESDLNDPRLITHREAGGYGLTAQWSDDFHHALYVSLTGDTTGYYADFESIEALAKVFESGFFHDGTKSSFRGRSQGRKIDTLHTPTWRLVVCSDNHDQIGNRATGERLSAKIGFRQLSLAAVVTLLSPFTPMIFMGEEWGASTPWQFFTSHPEPELGELVAKGRIEEFAQMEWDTSSVPNPQDPETFTRSKLNWAEPEGAAHADLLELNRRLLDLRRTYPDITDPRFGHGVTTADDDAGWLLIERGVVLIAVNFRAEATELDIEGRYEIKLNVGDCDFEDGKLRLDGHSAVVAERTDELPPEQTSPIPVVRR